MSLAKASVWTAGSTLIKIGAGLLVVKLLAVAFGPEGVGQAGNFRQMVMWSPIFAPVNTEWLSITSWGMPRSSATRSYR